MLDTAEDDTMDEKMRLQHLQVGLIQSLKSCHQFALDGGDSKAAWPLAQVRDPYKHTAFGGMKTELNLAASLLKAEADLQNRVRHTRPPARHRTRRAEQWAVRATERGRCGRTRRVKVVAKATAEAVRAAQRRTRRSER